MKTHRHGNDCHEERHLYAQIPRNRKHGTTHRATQGSSTRASQDAGGVRGKWTKGFIPQERVRAATLSRLRVGSFDNFGRLWGVGVAPTYPVTGPGVI